MMNSPNPVPQGQVNVPAVTPGAGALVGSILGAVLAAPAASAGIPPVIVQPIVSTLGAWFAHWLHSKLGTPE